MYKIDVICEQPNCENKGKIINTISGIKNMRDADLILEDTDGDEEDYCKECGILGTRKDPEIQAG